MYAVKFVAPDTIEGLAIPFGDENHRDLDGEWFTPNTDFRIDLFGKGGRPLLYDHGLDPAMKLDMLGRQVEYEMRPEGIWAQSQLDRAAKYRRAVDELIELDVAPRTEKGIWRDHSLAVVRTLRHPDASEPRRACEVRRQGVHRDGASGSSGHHHSGASQGGADGP
jgi:hypothetical protein